MTYVVIACHFAGKDKLCETTVERLRNARDRFKQGDKIVVTGDVPYETGGKTLAQLMRDWLVLEGGIPVSSVEIIKGGVGTFTEARTLCCWAWGRELTVISSSWYLFQGKPIWRKRADEFENHVRFVSVNGTGGWFTVLTYGLIGLAVRASMLFGFDGWLETRVTQVQRERINGFTYNGCM